MKRNYGAYVNGRLFIARVYDESEAVCAIWQQALISDLRDPVHMDKIKPFLVREKHEQTGN